MFNKSYWHEGDPRLSKSDEVAIAKSKISVASRAERDGGQVGLATIPKKKAGCACSHWLQAQGSGLIPIGCKIRVDDTLAVI